MGDLMAHVGLQMRQSNMESVFPKVFADTDRPPPHTHTPPSLQTQIDQAWTSDASSVLALRIYAPLTAVDTTEGGSLCTQWTVMPIPSLKLCGKVMRLLVWLQFIALIVLQMLRAHPQDGEITDINTHFCFKRSRDQIWNQYGSFVLKTYVVDVTAVWHWIKKIWFWN